MDNCISLESLMKAKKSLEEPPEFEIDYDLMFELLNESKGAINLFPNGFFDRPISIKEWADHMYMKFKF